MSSVGKVSVVCKVWRPARWIAYVHVVFLSKYILSNWILFYSIWSNLWENLCGCGDFGYLCNLLCFGNHMYLKHCMMCFGGGNHYSCSWNVILGSFSVTYKLIVSMMLRLAVKQCLFFYK